MSERAWLIVCAGAVIFVQLLMSAADGSSPFEGLWVFGALVFFVGPRMATFVALLCGIIAGAWLIRSITSWLSRRP